MSERNLRNTQNGLTLRSTRFNKGCKVLAKKILVYW